MNDLFKLPDAWEMIERISDTSAMERAELYDIYYNISTKIFDYRISKGWSQKELARVLGISQAMVSKLESGEYNYTVEQLWKISKKLGWKLNISFEGMDEEYKVCYEKDNIQILDMAVG
ncbi:MAG: helix-turn-helix transcriptional regulator [Firmicutes bacterium]|nr:helix-turn-helix transcriptional regulator [Bacillota bacterium]